MDAESRKAIRGLMATATDRPWLQGRHVGEPRALVSQGRLNNSLLAIDSDGMAIVDREADAELIVTAVNTLDQLLDTADQHEAEVLRGRYRREELLGVWKHLQDAREPVAERFEDADGRVTLNVANVVKRLLDERDALARQMLEFRRRAKPVLAILEDEADCDDLGCTTCKEAAENDGDVPTVEAHGRDRSWTYIRGRDVDLAPLLALADALRPQPSPPLAGTIRVTPSKESAAEAAAVMAEHQKGLAAFVKLGRDVVDESRPLMEELIGHAFDRVRAAASARANAEMARAAILADALRLAEACLTHEDAPPTEWDRAIAKARAALDQAPDGMFVPVNDVAIIAGNLQESEAARDDAACVPIVERMRAWIVDSMRKYGT